MSLSFTGGWSAITPDNPSLARGLTLNNGQIPPALSGVIGQLSSTFGGVLQYAKPSGDSRITISTAGVVSLSTPLGANGTATFVAQVTSDNGKTRQRSFTVKAQALGQITIEQVYSAIEGNGVGGVVTFRLRRTYTKGPASVTVTIAPYGKYPLDAADFGGAFPSKTITMVEGQSVWVDTFTLNPDVNAEPNEQGAITLSNPTVGYTVGNPVPFYAMNDDVSIIPQLGPASATVTTAIAKGDVVTAITGVPAGSTPRVNGDGRFVIAGSEVSGWNLVAGTTAVGRAGKVEITLSADGARSRKAIITIVETDTISVTNLTTIPEGNSGTADVSATFTRTNATGSATATYTLSGNGINAATAADFGGTWPTGTVTFAPGQTSKTQVVGMVLSDNVVELDEGIKITLTNPSSGYGIGAASAVAVIQNDDADASVPSKPAPRTIQYAGDNAYLSNTYAVGSWGTHDSLAQISWARTSAFHDMKSVGFILANSILDSDSPYEDTTNMTVELREGALVIGGVNVPITVTATTFGGVEILEIPPVPASSFGPYISFGPVTPVGIVLHAKNVNSPGLPLSTYLTGNTKQKVVATGKAFSFSSAENPNYTVAGTISGATLPVPVGGTSRASGALFMGLIGEAVSWSQAVANSGMTTGDSIEGTGNGPRMYGWHTDLPFAGLCTYASSSQGNQWNSVNTALREKLSVYADRGDFMFGANDFVYNSPVATLQTAVTNWANKTKAKGTRFHYAMMAYPRVSNMPILGGSVSGTTCTLNLPPDVTSRMAVGMTINVVTNAGTAASVPYAINNVAITAINGNTISYEKVSNPPTAPFTISGAFGNALLYNINDSFKSDVFTYPASASFMPGGGRFVYNSTGLDGLISSGVLDGKIDTTPVWGPVRPEQWLTNHTVAGLNGNGTGRIYCGDGIHPSDVAMVKATEAERLLIRARLGASAPPAEVAQNLSPPTISGTAKEGLALTGDRGVWDIPVSSWVDTWERSADASEGSWTAVSASISRTLTANDKTQFLRFGTRPSNGPGFVYSEPIGPVAAADVALPTITQAPTLDADPDGTRRVGDSFTVVAATHNGDSAKYYLVLGGVVGREVQVGAGNTWQAGDVAASVQIRVVATKTGVGDTPQTNATNYGPVVAAAVTPVGETVIVSNSLENATASAKFAGTTYVVETGQSMQKAGVPDAATVFGASGNHTISANNTRLITGTGAQVPLVYATGPLPAINASETPWRLNAQPASAILYVSCGRMKQTTRGMYAGGLNSGTSAAGQQWTIRKGIDTVTSNSATAASAAFLNTVLATGTTSPNIQPGGYFVTKLKTTPQQNGDMLIELFADIKDGNGMVKVLEATDLAANNPFLDPGLAGHFTASPGSGSTLVNVCADQQPIRVLGYT